MTKTIPIILLPFVVYLCVILSIKYESQNSFEGVWRNKDENTRSITKCEIRYDNNRIYVHLWGACLPEDCDWGETFTYKSVDNTNKIEITWDQGFVERIQVLEFIDGIFVMSTESRYRDGRPNNIQIDHFVRL